MARLAALDGRRSGDSRPQTDQRRLAFDAALALGLAAIALSIVWTFDGMSWLAPTLAVVHTAPIAARRRAPLASAVLGLAAAMAFIVAGFPMVGLGPAALVWLYSVGAEIDRPRSIGVLAVTEACLAVVLAIGGQGDASTVVGDGIVLAVAFLLGDGARRRRELLALHRDRADHLERTRDEEARRAVVEERLRIARELHDVVAHSMSIVAIQSGTGRLAIDDGDAPRAREALGVIETTSRAALDEMRTLLGVLRNDDGGSGRAPAPTLDDVDALVDRTRATGADVSVVVDGDRGPLPAGLELAAYRILQEALTNAARHAPGAAVEVRMTHGEAALTIEVVNGPGATHATPPDGSGLGLVGMRERAAAYGGTLTTARRLDGGFLVRAELHAP